MKLKTSVPLCTMLRDDPQGECTLSLLLELINRNDDYERIGDEMLRIVSESLGAARGFVFRYGDDYISPPLKIFEWLAPAKLPPLMPEDFSGCLDALLEQRPVILKAGDLADGRQPDIQCRLLSGIWANDRLYGFVGIDYCSFDDNCSDSVVKILRNAAIMFALAFKQTHQHEQLLETASQSRQIMDNLPLPILLVDTDFRVRAANPTKKINVDLPLPKLLGTFCYETVCKFGAPPEFCAVQETLHTGQPSRKEFSFGGKRLISTSQPIFDRHGKMKSVLSVDIDITEVTRQKEALEAAMEQAQAANLAKSYFLATVSHELRTPLNAVIGFSEILQNGNVDAATQQEYLNAINFAGTSLLNLINDVLDLSNLEADKVLIDPVKSDVADLLQQVATVFTLKARQKGIRLEVDAAALCYPLYVDSLCLRQILLNLIGNAIKFTTEGGVTVRGAFAAEDDRQGLLRISVSDTGVGISSENQERIFEPFVHDSIIRGKRMYEGSGLGLTISRRLADKMGGSIRLESEPGKGSTFILEIRVKYDTSRDDRQDDAARKTATAAQSGTVTGERHMLLVDDVPINLKVLEVMLTRLGIQCTSVESPEAAIELLRQGKCYDMILTDMWMPGMNGLEMARYIRQDLRITDVPILAITADTQVSTDERAAFDYILYKPITLESLTIMLNDMGVSAINQRR